MDLQKMQVQEPCWRKDVQEVQVQIPEAQKKDNKGKEDKRVILTR
jgi:hypothetical protein